MEDFSSPEGKALMFSSLSEIGLVEGRHRILQDINSTIPFISDQLDSFFNDLGVPIFHLMAILAIITGLLLAAAGPRGQGPRLIGFISGFAVTSFCAAIILMLFEESQGVDTSNFTSTQDGSSESLDGLVWISIFFGAGLVGGLLASCLIGWLRISLGIASGLVVAGFLIQVGLGDLIGNNIVILVLVILACLISIYVAWKLVDVIYVLLSAGYGGFLILLGVGFYTGSEITLQLIVTEPSEIEVCSDSSCTIPVVLAVLIICVSLFVNVRRYIGVKKKAEARQVVQEQVNKESDGLVDEMKKQREFFEQRLKDLENRNQNLLTEMNNNDAVKQIQEQQAEAQKAHEDLKRQVSEVNAQKAAAEREAAEMRAQLNSTNKDKEDLVEQLSNKNTEVLLEIQKERARQKQREAELEAEKLRLDEEREAKDKALDETRREKFVALQKQIAESTLRVQTLESDFKDNVRIENRLHIQLPRQMKARKRVFFGIVPELGESEPAFENEMAREMRERAEEFGKFKTMVADSRKNQKEVLKTIKNALNEIEKLSKQVRKLSMKFIKEDSLANQQGIRREKDVAISDIEVKLGVLESLLVRFEEINNTFSELISDMEVKVGEFREMEKKIENMAKLEESSLKKYPASVLDAVEVDIPVLVYANQGESSFLGREPETEQEFDTSQMERGLVQKNQNSGTPRSGETIWQRREREARERREKEVLTVYDLTEQLLKYTKVKANRGWRRFKARFDDGR